MGINAEFIELICRLRAAGHLRSGETVVELGAQDVAALPQAVQIVLRRNGHDAEIGQLTTAAGCYAALGFSAHAAIDATAAQGALLYDLNHDLEATYAFSNRFDLVTNLGTTEHVFDQQAAFANMHALCRVGGLMIHCLPAQGLVNHGFYNYHPRFIADLAVTNGYEIVSLDFTCNFTPELLPYTLETFRAHDTTDIMLYSVLRRLSEDAFRLPFDSIFADYSKLGGYAAIAAQPGIAASAFAAYVKKDWSGATGGLLLDPARASVIVAEDGPPALAKVPTRVLAREIFSRFARRFADQLRPGRNSGV